MIVFSHANSFPAGTYRQLFDAWRDAGHTVHAIEKYGHDERYPVTQHWPHLRKQLIDFIEANSREPVFLVGHSLGGFLSLLAAAKKPSLAKGVVMLDSPVISGLLARTIGFAQFTGVGKRFSPSRISKNRRQHWPSIEAAQMHFAGKPLFARWAPEVLADYVRCGIVDSQSSPDAGVTLNFHRDVESRIYDTIPYDIPAFLRRHPLQCPAAFIGGTQSTEVKQVGTAYTKRLTEGRLSWIEGSHLFPFEKPRETAAEVLRWLGVLAR